MTNDELIKQLDPATVQEFRKAVENVRVHLGSLLTEDQIERLIREMVAKAIHNELT